MLTQPAYDAALPGKSARIGRFAGGILAALAVWFTILTATPLIEDKPGQYLVIGPSATRFSAILGTSALLVGEGPGFTQIAGADAGMVSQLYGNGAWLVLPADRAGCMQLTK